MMTRTQHHAQPELIAKAATLIEAARLGGCHELLSEDLADGQDYDGVTVRNPFRG